MMAFDCQNHSNPQLPLIHKLLHQRQLSKVFLQVRTKRCKQKVGSHLSIFLPLWKILMRCQCLFHCFCLLSTDCWGGLSWRTLMLVQRHALGETQPLWVLPTSCNLKPSDTEGPVVFQTVCDQPSMCQSKHLGE